MKRPMIVIAVLLLALFGCPGLWDGITGNGEDSDGSLNASGYSAQVDQHDEKEGEEEEPPVVIPPVPPEPEDPKDMLEYYLTVEMMDENGAVRNEYANGRAYVLAETTGQMMEYALLTNDRELFDLEAELLENYYLDNEYGIAYSAIWADDYSPKENKSSTDDNMRFVWALYKAEEKWGGGNYSKLGGEIAEQMVSYNTYQNILSKGIEWDGSEYTISKRMNVDGLRWIIMQDLAERNPIWRILLEKTTPLFLECQHEGLFWQEYDIAKSRPVYPEGKDVCLTSHMLKAGMYFSEYKTYVPASALNTRMQNEWENKGKISSAYYMEYLGTGNGVEEAETYALAGRNAILLDDCEFALVMQERIMMYQVQDEESDLYGSVGGNKGENGVEDEIDSLLLMLELETCEPNR